MTSIRSRLVLTFALAVYLSMALAGIHFGLPDSEHNLSYNCDETTWLGALSQIKPGERKFNPHPYLTHPTLYLEMYLVAVAVGAKTGWIPIHQDKEWFRTHPDVFARFYLAGRYLQVLCGLVLLLLLWWIANRLYNPWIANVSTLLLSVTPSLISASHFSQASLPVTLFSLLALGLMMFFAQTAYKDLRWFYVSAFVLGCAVSAKFSALALMPVIAYCTLNTEKPIRYGTIAALLWVFGFLIGSPFALLAPDTFWPAFFWHVGHQQAPIHNFFASLLFPFQYPFDAALGPVLLIAVLASGLYYLKTKKIAADVLLLIWTIAFLAGTVRVGTIAASARVLIALPALLLITAIALHRFRVNHPKTILLINGAVGLLFVITAGYAGTLVQLRNTPPLQKTVSTWIEQNIPTTASIGLPREIFWWTPDIVYQSAHHPERMKHPYPIIDLKYSAVIGEQTKPDYIVASTLERSHCKDQIGITAEQCNDFENWLNSGEHYELMKFFPRRLALGPWEWKRREIPGGFEDDVWATSLTVYKRRETPVTPR